MFFALESYVKHTIKGEVICWCPGPAFVARFQPVTQFTVKFFGIDPGFVMLLGTSGFEHEFKGWRMTFGGCHGRGGRGA